MISDTQYKQCLKRFPSAELDVFHDVILELEAHTPEGIRSIEAIIPRRIKNREIDLWRKSQRFIPISDDAIQAQQSKEHDPLEELEFNESQELVRNFMQLLTPNHQEILRLVYFEGFSQERIAELRGCTPQSVQAMLVRAKVALKQLFDQYSQERNS